MKNEKRLLNDIERAYELTLSDIARYKRQAGTITVDVVKRLIRWNYFNNEDAVDFYYYVDEGCNNIIVKMDMLDLKLWILENYDIEADRLDDIEEELDFLATFYINN